MYTITLLPIQGAGGNLFDIYTHATAEKIIIKNTQLIVSIKVTIDLLRSVKKTSPHSCQITVFALVKFLNVLENQLSLNKVI